MDGENKSKSVSIDVQEAKRIADLARLELSAEEAAQYAAQLELVLGYVQKLSLLDTESVEPMAHVLDVANVDREDEVRDSLPREKALANAPDTDGVFYRVPRIIE